MIYNKISLKSYGRNINLEFKARTTLLGGDSGIGKTLIYNLLDDLNDQDKFKKIYCINSKFVYKQDLPVINILKSKKDKFIVIDNAEEILGKQERQFICQNHINQYLILGRCKDFLGLGSKNIGTLIVTKGEMYIQYKEFEELQAMMNRERCFELKLP